MYEYLATVERVVDGDTVDLNIDLGFDVWNRQRVRLSGIDTPETRTRDLREKRYGYIAMARVIELLLEGEVYVVHTTLDKRGKFGRAMADFVLADGRMLCGVLLEERLAVAYHGQAKSQIRAAHEANWDYLDNRERAALTAYYDRIDDRGGGRVSVP